VRGRGGGAGCRVEGAGGHRGNIARVMRSREQIF